MIHYFFKSNSLVNNKPIHLAENVGLHNHQLPRDFKIKVTFLL
ncbi:hypothetical protein RU89_GL002393 [Lactococcus cremoris]|nr:hypothetical protein llh_0270 [Lactococcus cremoris subsp. cremoris A76]KZK13095.1 hypothetical protein AB995_0843 [Lactococcus cremoris]KZK41308.1 hypothetical protein LMG6897_1013 [Lactococcus cremoris]KZK41411.1 hypothetical protein B40_2041 [Lactococcus cremoris]PCS12290.1 hypothetical protein RU89_GL002393 [Lactococcus cremoris]